MIITVFSPIFPRSCIQRQNLEKKENTKETITSNKCHLISVRMQKKIFKFNIILHQKKKIQNFWRSPIKLVSAELGELLG